MEIKLSQLTKIWKLQLLNHQKEEKLLQYQGSEFTGVVL